MYRIERFSEDFVSKFFQLSVDKLSSIQIENFLIKTESLLPKFYFTRTSEINLLRILENQFQLNLFINDVLKYEHYLEILLTITSYSNYLTDILVQNPGYFYWITNPEVINKKLNKKYFEDSIRKIDSNFSNFNSKVNSLRNFKKQEILRIGILDYFQNEPLIKISKLLSLLANSINSYLFSLCLKEIKNKYGIKKLPGYCLISLGKLGGEELNYSSDIDLILFTETNQQLTNNLFSNTIFENAVKLFINTSSQLTEKGDLYRIDFRLRPYGRNSELVNTISNYLYYYENQSEQWEKQMLVKCSYLGGDKRLFNRFYSYIQNIIYPKTFFSSPIEKLKSLKVSIEKNVNSEQNIKLSSGGIRDIEFAIQALQLLNGGRNPELREKNSLKTIKKLFKYNLINKTEYSNLKSNYILFRKIEHFMQLMNNFQTHLIPESNEILEKLSFKLNYSDSEFFLKDIGDKRKFNESFFNQIVSPSQSENLFDKINFADKKKAISNYNFLSTGIGLINTKKFDESTVNSFNEISDSIISYLSNSLNPDQTLENFAKIIKSYSLPKYLYDTLKDKKILELLLKICEQSKFLFNILLESKQAEDLFFSHNALNALDENNFTDIEPNLFRFFSGLQLFEAIIETSKFHKLQTKYYKHQIINLIRDEGFDKKYKEDLMIIGLGSFAAEEMNLFSDIDLVFILNHLEKYTQAQSDFQNLLLKIKTHLKIDVDCRLRPEGKSSPLVWNYKDYISYIQNRAEVWEFLTFSKSILVFGDEKQFDFLMNKISEKVLSLDDKKIKNDLIIMRNKLTTDSEFLISFKKIKGGLIDLYFIIGYYSLLLCGKIHNLFKMPTLNKIELIYGFLKEEILFQNIKNNYLFLKNFEIFYQIFSGSKSIYINQDSEYLKYFNGIKYFNSEKDIIKKLNEVTAENLKFFNKTFF